MKLNERLKLARKQKGFTQQEVAESLHISRATISSWEVGRTLPSLDFIIDLSVLYDLSLDILLKEDMTMVNKVNKELKSKKIYKGIVIGVGSLLAIFIMINLVWLFHLNNQYSYLDKNWYLDDKVYTYDQGDIKMMSSKTSFKEEIKDNYLKKERLWISAFKGDSREKGYKPSVMINEEEKVFARVPLDEGETTFMSVRIDRNGHIVDDSNNPDFLDQDPFKEQTDFIVEFLEENQPSFKELYATVEEQSKLINKEEK